MSKAPTGERKFLKIQEAAEALGIHRNTLRKLCSEGKFPHQRFGRSIRISAAKLDELATSGGAPE